MSSDILSKLYNKYTNTNLVFRIIVGISFGVGLALFFPTFKYVGIFGELFIGALKAIAPILVFTLIISSLVQEQARRDGRFNVIVLLYMISTFLASCISFCNFACSLSSSRAALIASFSSCFLVYITPFFSIYFVLCKFP